MGDGVVVAKQKRMRVTSLLCFFFLENKKYQNKQINLKSNLFLSWVD